LQGKTRHQPRAAPGGIKTADNPDHDGNRNRQAEERDAEIGLEKAANGGRFTQQSDAYDAQCHTDNPTKESE
jgi:hypothetical protein